VGTPALAANCRATDMAVYPIHRSWLNINSKVVIFALDEFLLALRMLVKECKLEFMKSL